MKRLLFSICYWAVALPLLSVILLSLDYTFSQALLISTTILPSVLIIKALGRDIDWKKRGDSIIKIFILTCLVLVVNYFCLYLLHYSYLKVNEMQGIIQNPVFLLLIICFFTGINSLAENALCSRRVERDKYIEFTSDRRPVKVELDSIKVVESNDDEVWVRMADGTAYRTKMAISAWEGALDDRFMRVHRSFIVNKTLVTETGSTYLMLGDTRVEVSRKYREKVHEELDIRGN